MTTAKTLTRAFIITAGIAGLLFVAKLAMQFNAIVEAM